MLLHVTDQIQQMCLLKHVVSEMTYYVTQQHPPTKQKKANTSTLHLTRKQWVNLSSRV